MQSTGDSQPGRDPSEKNASDLPKTRGSGVDSAGVAVVGVIVLVCIGLALWVRPNRRGSSEGASATHAPPNHAQPASHGLAIPIIDVHTHIAPALADYATYLVKPHRVRLMLNASGGRPGSPYFVRSLASGRILPYCNVPLGRALQPGFAEFAEQFAAACRAEGGIGIKIPKGLGLGVIEQDGSLVRVDDARYDPLFDAAGRARLPILIHSGDPQAFFRPATPDNERYDELSAHPGWSFYGPITDGPPGSVWPSWESVFEQFEARVARHPGTKFLGAHFGNCPEEPDRVARLLAKYPNLYIETGARVPEIGRKSPEVVRGIFERFPDRILFGTDLAVTPDGLTLGSSGEEPDREDQVPEFFAAHFRYFETNTTNLAHPTPIQGRWRINGIGLPRSVLERFYFRNAEALFGVTLPVD